MTALNLKSPTENQRSAKGRSRRPLPSLRVMTKMTSLKRTRHQRKSFQWRKKFPLHRQSQALSPSKRQSRCPDEAGERDKSARSTPPSSTTLSVSIMKPSKSPPSRLLRSQFKKRKRIYEDIQTLQKRISPMTKRNMAQRSTRETISMSKFEKQWKRA